MARMCVARAHRFGRMDSWGWHDFAGQNRIVEILLGQSARGDRRAPGACGGNRSSGRRQGVAARHDFGGPASGPAPPSGRGAHLDAAALLLRTVRGFVHAGSAQHRQAEGPHFTRQRGSDLDLAEPDVAAGRDQGLRARLQVGDRHGQGGRRQGPRRSLFGRSLPARCAMRCAATRAARMRAAR